MLHVCIGCIYRLLDVSMGIPRMHYTMHLCVSVYACIYAQSAHQGTCSPFWDKLDGLGELEFEGGDMFEDVTRLGYLYSRVQAVEASFREAVEASFRQVVMRHDSDKLWIAEAWSLTAIRGD